MTPAPSVRYGLRVMITLVLAASCSMVGYAQEETGFYTTVPCKAAARGQVSVRFDNHMWCVLKKPVIPATEFLRVDELQTFPDLRTSFFDLHLSPKGYSTLKQVAASLPDAQLVLLVDGAVAFVVQPGNMQLQPTLRIGGNDKSIDLIVLHRKMEAAITPR